MKVLVTGGAGYIGSFMTKSLLESSHTVTVADNLSRGVKEAVSSDAKLVVGDLRNKKFVEELFEGDSFDAVIHFAGLISMGESMREPGMYFEANILPAINLLEEMRKRNSNKFIFSSTAGVYGNPDEVPIPEDHPTRPTNPYGESKRMVERVLQWYMDIHGLSSVSLRYFNASGAALDGKMGENHNPETHLIPNAIKAALENTEFVLFGNDYQTPDGSCIRDYIHIVDLVDSHLRALQKLVEDKGAFVFNVGVGRGHSNKEVIAMVKRVSGVDFPVKFGERRPGDADQLIADPTRIQKELGFVPKYSDLETIVKTAWEWHKKNLKLGIENSK